MTNRPPLNVPVDYDAWLRREDTDPVAAMCRFFMEDDPVHRALTSIATKLDELGIPYAIAGAMALAAHRFIRATVDVDILVGHSALETIHEHLDDLGYARPFAGSRNLRDTETGVRIKFFVEGQFPGDGKPTPLPFPNPDEAGQTIRGIRYLRLPVLVELKLASGMTSAGRLKDLADVQELIRTLGLPRDFADQLNAYVREKFDELWQGVASDNPSE
jgi:hypothetical protein